MTTTQIPAPADVKQCEVCTATIVRRAGENRGRFATRRFCSRDCMGTARRSPNYKPAQPSQPALPTADDEVTRSNWRRTPSGVWRPPGWSDAPAMPARTRAATR